MNLYQFTEKKKRELDSYTQNFESFSSSIGTLTNEEMGLPDSPTEDDWEFSFSEWQKEP